MAVSLGVCVAIFEKDSVLLTLRQDFPVWCLPGGGVEANESLPLAAIREVREETGLDIKLSKLIGLYFREQGKSGNHQALFCAETYGGLLNADGIETLKVEWFPISNLPDRLLGYHRLFIRDAVESDSVVSRTLKILPAYSHLTRKEIYELRDQGKLDMKQVIEELCAPINNENIMNELP